MTANDSITPRLKPLKFGEMLDVAFKICTTNAATLIKAVLIVVVPLQILTAVVIVSAFGGEYFQLDSTFDTSTTDEDELESGAEIGAIFVVFILMGLTYLISIAACFRAVAQGYLGEETDWKASLAFGWRKMMPLLWLSILYGLGVTLGTIALIIPGIYLFFRWFLSYPALLIEDIRGRKALKRSSELVKDSWWRCTGVLFFGYLMTSMISFMLQFVIAIPIIIGFSDDTVAGVIFNTVASSVGQVVSTPLMAAITAVLYFDMRVRKEGFDLELLAKGIGASAPSSYTGPAPVGPITSGGSTWDPPPASSTLPAPAWSPSPSSPPMPSSSPSPSLWSPPTGDPPPEPQPDLPPSESPGSGGFLPPRPPPT